MRKKVENYQSFVHAKFGAIWPHERRVMAKIRFMLVWQGKFLFARGCRTGNKSDATIQAGTKSRGAVMIGIVSGGGYNTLSREPAFSG